MASPTDVLSPAETRGLHVKAGLLMVLANLLLIVNDTGAKLLTSGMNEGSVICLRNGIGSVALLAYVMFNGETGRLGGGFGRVALIRTLLDGLLTMLFFIALAQMPIANLTAIVQSMPIVVAAMAAYTLRERLRLGRMLIILGGFAGVLLIVQPGGDDFSAYSILGVMVVFLGAARDILTRRIRQDVPDGVIAFGNIFGVALMGAVMAQLQGGLDWPDARGWAIGMISGLSVAFGLILLIRTLRMAPLSVTAPFRYSVVLWSIVSGYLVFGDVPNGLAIAGIGLIVISGIAALRERT